MPTANQLGPPLRFAGHAAAPSIHKDVTQVKPKASASSTSATRLLARFTPGPRAVAIWLASGTIISLPLAHEVLRSNPRLALLVGLIPAIPLVLMTVAFIAAYISMVALAIVMVIIYVASGRGDPINCLTAMFIWCVNVPIAFVTMKPLSLRSMPTAELTRTRNRRTQGQLSPLPAATGAARHEDTPKFWETFMYMAQMPGGAPDIVGDAQQPATGRHAKQNADHRAKEAESAAKAKVAAGS
jgi:hypothetical protein